MDYGILLLAFLPVLAVFYADYHFTKQVEKVLQDGLDDPVEELFNY